MGYLFPVADPSFVEASDESIVARVVAGDTEAFELLMRRHNRRVYRAVRAILRNDGEAEDAMQEAYVSAFAHLRDFGGRSRFSTWLVRIAVYEALGRLRRGKRVRSTTKSSSWRRRRWRRRHEIQSRQRATSSFVRCSRRPWIASPSSIARCS
jgi:RNA polymerase sigma factor (sigma-70 family)